MSKLDQEKSSFELAQQNARLLYGVNTPPTFITRTRDFYIDVGRFPLGTKLTTITAFDLEGDTLEYWLEEAPSNDASPYFAINSTTGELKLDHKPFNLQSEDSASKQRARFSSDHHEQQSATNQKNTYILNVVASDGKYASKLELLIHVFDSTSLSTTSSHSQSHTSLNLEGELTGDIDEAESLTAQHETTSEAPTLIPSSSISKEDDHSKEFSFSSISSSSPRQSSSGGGGTTSLEPQLFAPMRASTTTITTSNQQLLPRIPSPNLPQGLINPTTIEKDQALVSLSPELVLSLVGLCTLLMLILVSLMFIVPLSVKRLRRRVKHVERQHQHLSRQNSSGCSTVFSSSDGTSSSGSSQLPHHHHLHHHHISGPNSSVNTISTSNHLSLYGQHPRQFLMEDNLDSFCFSLKNATKQFNPRDDHDMDRDEEAKKSNIYCPIDNDFYSTINTINDQVLQPDNLFGSVMLERQQHSPTGRLRPQPLCFGPSSNLITSANSNECQPPAEFCEQQQPPPPPPPIRSPIGSDSGSSTRSLVRFLSLPARKHSLYQHDEQGEEKHKEDEYSIALEEDNPKKSEHKTTSTTTKCTEFGRFHETNPFTQHTNCNNNSKTIARTCQLDREPTKFSSSNARKDCWELDRFKLLPLDMLDQGQFGQVWRYKLKTDSNDSKGETVVAVKMLKSGAMRDKRSREELLAEIEIMKLISSHPNVVQLLHCCTQDSLSVHSPDRPILLVMEYVELGKLQSFLERSRSSSAAIFDSEYESAENTTITDPKDLLKFIYHVAKGMEHISSLCIVHRDLASRNILVSSQRICKIGDFGMARQMQSLGSVYERHSRNTKIPVRWMAPEVLLNNKFTTKSDVFSFGILMWEIVTLASTPYRHLKTEQVIEAVARKGERPGRPAHCHEQLYEMMAQCWAQEPEQRPTFRRLVKQLEELLHSSNNYIQLDQVPENEYYNIPEAAAPDELL